ncbi:MAG TPA: hypothetical protein VHW92_07460 [Mycobacteriales bacterium]|nr:hypothetical protein [Mycobacteriales bacterium]
MLALVIAEGVAVALLGLLVAGLLRSHAEILRALHDLGADLDPDGRAPVIPATRVASLRAEDIAHDIAGQRLDGSAAAVGVVGAPHDSVLAFLSSGCATCHPFWDSLRAGVSPVGDSRVVVVVQDEDNRSRLQQLAGADLDVVASSRAWADYGVPGSPHIVQVHGPTGRVVGEGTGQTWEQVMDLLSHGDDARRGSRQEPGTDDRDNATRIDAELAAAGIGPGHPSLHDERPPLETG